jgi:hypothetical protein
MKNSNLSCIENAFGKCTLEMLNTMDKQPMKEQLKFIRYVRQQVKKYGNNSNKNALPKLPVKNTKVTGKRKTMTNLWAPRK